MRRMSISSAPDRSARLPARAVRHRGRARMPAQDIAAFLPPPPKGRTSCSAPARPAARWPRRSSAVAGSAAVGPGRHALRPRAAGVPAATPGASRWSRPRTRCPTRPAGAPPRASLELAQGLSADDLVLCLISGGGSALLALPAEGWRSPTSRRSTRRCSNSGAAIDEMNCVRKHLSAIKGGRLGAMCAPAQGRHAADLRRARRRARGDRAAARRCPIRPPAPTRWRSSRATASTFPSGARRRSRAARSRRRSRATRASPATRCT